MKAIKPELNARMRSWWLETARSSELVREAAASSMAKREIHRLREETDLAPRESSWCVSGISVLFPPHESL